MEAMETLAVIGITQVLAIMVADGVDLDRLEVLASVGVGNLKKHQLVIFIYYPESKVATFDSKVKTKFFKTTGHLYKF
jgi:hypothetical protein